MSRFGLKKTDLIIQNTKSLPWRRKNTSSKTIQSPAIKEMKKASIKKRGIDIEILVGGKDTSEVVNSNYDDSKLSLEKEAAEQDMFELLENKVLNDSFNLENSFFSRFLRQSNLEYSGESTPVVLQHCLTNNPNLMKILPNILRTEKSNETDDEMCCNEYIDCCSDTCSSVSTCCSCKTIEAPNSSIKEEKHIAKKSVTYKQPKQKIINKTEISQPPNRKLDKPETKQFCSDDIDNSDNIKTDMVEINAKLIATSELLKDRLKELEDEIDTFRKENANLSKMREDIEAEKVKFYEDKTLFEQKLNEEKILAEYYLADEKEKLIKQKQMYEKYVREIRGRLNKKDKEEVINLKKEISDLREEIRLKDAKSTSSLARLRNHIKILEKEKKDLQDEIEKLIKENRRIQHNNDMTRRISNIKYLEEINKKLSDMTSKETRSEVDLDNNAKYKTYEIQRQKKINNRILPKSKPLTRAKSVPNLKVTSRYAKYFSQRDIISDFEKKKNIGIEPANSQCFSSDYEESEADSYGQKNYDTNNDIRENKIEKLYMESFHSPSQRSYEKENSKSYKKIENCSSENPDRFFISKTNIDDNSTFGNHLMEQKNFTASNLQQSTSPSPQSLKSLESTDERYLGAYCQQSNSKTSEPNSAQGQIYKKSQDSSTSPVSILTNRSSSSHKTATVINRDYLRDTLSLSPEPTSSTSSIIKTNLKPTEIKKPDGSKELRFPNGNMKFISADGTYSKFVYYNGDIKENFYSEGRIKYFYEETKTYHTTYADGLEVLEFPDGQVEKRYKDGSTEIRLPNGSIRYFDPKNEHIREEWRFPDGTTLTVSAIGEQRITFTNGQVEVHAEDHKRREFPDGTVKLMYNDGTSETRYASGRIRIKDKHGNLIMDSSSR
ncbi:hypothetical protein ACJJTC_001499 [Scirpophaga incertulas]